MLSKFKKITLKSLGYFEARKLKNAKFMLRKAKFQHLLMEDGRIGE